MARRANVPLSSIKYYQREGLLPAGVRSAPNQVQYDESHVRRVRLIRALLETGGLSVAATRAVIGVLDADDAPVSDAFRVAQHAMSRPRTAESAPSVESRDRIARATRARGWTFSDDNPGLDAAARALDGLRSIDFDPPDFFLDAYADAADGTASADLRALGDLSEPDHVAELMVVGTVLGDALFAGLRRIAQQSATHDHFPNERTETPS